MQTKLNNAVQYLAELGAILSTPGQRDSELAELGRIAINLPLDARPFTSDFD